ncbi:MAG: ABC transporter permease subunit [Pirellulales bacterium]
MSETSSRKHVRLRMHRSLYEGELAAWATAGGLALCAMFLVWVLGIIVWNGSLAFWPRAVRLLPTRSHAVVVGEELGEEWYSPTDSLNTMLSPTAQKHRDMNNDAATGDVANVVAQERRLILRLGNAQPSDPILSYIPECEFLPSKPLYPQEVLCLDRQSAERSIGFPLELRRQFQFDPSNLPDWDPVHTATLTFEWEPEDETYRSMLQWMDNQRSEAKQAWQTRALGASSPRNELSVEWEEDSLVVTDPHVIEQLLPHWMAENYRWQGERTTIRKVLKEFDEELHLIRQQEGQQLEQTKIVSSKWSPLFHRQLQKELELEHQLDLLDQARMAMELLDWSANWKSAWEGKAKEKRNQLEGELTEIRESLDALLKTLETAGSRQGIIHQLGGRWKKLVRQRMEWETRAKRIEREQKGMVLVLSTGHKFVIPSEDDSKDQAIRGFATPIVSWKESFQLLRDVREGRDRHWVTWRDPNQEEVNAPLPTLEVPVHDVVRYYKPNHTWIGNKLVIYLGRWKEFLVGGTQSQESSSGIFSAIWGTIVLTIAMSILVIPLGVLTALYLAEYSKRGLVLRAVRVCIINLAGVPSILYGVFGLSFFCHGIGAYIDGGPARMNWQSPATGWWLLAGLLLAVVGTACFLGSWLSRIDSHRSAWNIGKRWGWSLCFVGGALLLIWNPFFTGFFADRLPAATFGQPGILWASLTMALLTLPVVIATSEEAILAVPQTLREGSYACGASHWQTIRNVVLPNARSGILTGAILAIARGTGEVAPLMLVGALPMAMALPLDGEFPYFHGSRGFMHLGVHVFTLGFQSHHVDAAIPRVFTIMLLLVLITTCLNLLALRLRYRARFQKSDSPF